MKQHSIDTSARSRSHALLVEHTASTHPQNSSSAHRPRAARPIAFLAVTACCAALLSVVELAVSAPASASTIPTPAYTASTNVSDAMKRTVAPGFGGAPLGGSYTTAPQANFSVSGGAGRISSVPTRSDASATLSATTGPDQRLQSAFVLPNLPINGIGVYYQLVVRRSGTSSYRIQLLVAPNHRMTLMFAVVHNGVSTAVGTRLTLPQQVGAGQTILLEGMAVASSPVVLRSRAWVLNTPLPGWQLGASDSGAARLTGGGQVGVDIYTAGNTAALPVRVISVNGWAMTVAGSTPAPVRTGKPGPTNTGVPAGTTLTPRYGNWIITTPNVTYDALDIHGFVTIQAANVSITRSIIRGGVAPAGSNPGIVTATSTATTNFRLTDSELVPEHPSVAIDGMRGWNYTLTRVNIHGTSDSSKIIGDNATIQNSWLHDTVYYLHDPWHNNGPSHNDGVQVLNGHHIRILNNTINGASNSALQVTQGNGAVGDLSFSGNWADGGTCTVNVNNYPLVPITAVTVSNNRFGHASTTAGCAIIITKATQRVAVGNVYDDTGAAVVIKNGG